MTPAAIVMMIIAMVTVWGGLGLACHPEDEDELPTPEEMPHEL